MLDYVVKKKITNTKLLCKIKNILLYSIVAGIVMLATYMTLDVIFSSSVPQYQPVLYYNSFIISNHDIGYNIKRIGLNVPDTCASIYEKKETMKKDAYDERITKIYIENMKNSYGDDHVIILYYK